jgi:hypothetical protein
VNAEAVSVYEEAGSHGDALGASLEVAECELLLGRLEETERLLVNILPRLPDLSDQTMDIQALRVAGMLAASSGEPERAAFLFGAVDGKIRDSALELYAPIAEEIRASFAERARRDLGEDRFRTTYQRGWDMRQGNAEEIVSAP